MHPQCFPWVHLLSLSLSHTHMRFARRLDQLCGQTFDNLSDESLKSQHSGFTPSTPLAAGPRRGLLLWLVPCHGVDEHIDGPGWNPFCHLTMCTVGAHAHDRHAGLRHSIARMAPGVDTRILILDQPSMSFYTITHETMYQSQKQNTDTLI